MFERTRPIRDPVHLTFDGAEITAERGEPLAVALLASGSATLARSPKLHRPRGPACLRGDCDGCIARVNGVPNVMTCLRPSAGGEAIEAQNVLGSRNTDLLRITDWFFPQGIDHHHLMAGIPGVGSAMQTFARQMAGIGRLPDAPRAPAPARRAECDVLIVGGGLSGLACARRLGKNLRVVLVHEGLSLGGSASHAPEVAHLLAELVKDVHACCEVMLAASVVGFYEGEALIASDERATILRPRELVVATGAHDGALCVPGNDLPGVMSARAVSALAARGILPTDGAVIVGDGPWASRLAKILGDRLVASLSAADVEEITGRSQVKGIKKKGAKKIACGVVAVALPSAPAFQIAVQAGARTRATDAGFEVITDDRGRAGEHLYAIGECTGIAFDPDALVSNAEKAAAKLGEEFHRETGRRGGQREE